MSAIEQHDERTQITKAVVYCRVSSKRQRKEGHGPSSQETRCRDYAQRYGYDVLEVFPDKAISGGKLHRPSFNRLLKFVEAQDSAVVVIIDDISRFSRDIESHWALRRALTAVGGKLESPSVQFGEDAHSILIENLLTSVSQHQRQHNGEQTRNRMQARAKNGYWCFPPPPGYEFKKIPSHGKVLAPKDPVARIIKTALNGFAVGHFETQAEVKRYLESEPDYPKNNRGEVRCEEVVRMLTRPIYAGYIHMLKGHHEGIVIYENFAAIQRRIENGARAPARADIYADFPLRGFVTCGDCDKPMTSCWSKSKTGKKHPYYMCFNKSCDSYRKSIRRDELQGAFETLLRTVQPAPRMRDLAFAMLKKASGQHEARAEAARKAVKRDLNGVESQIDSLVDRIPKTTSETVMRAFEDKIEILEDQKRILSEKLARAPQPMRTFEEVFELAMAFSASPWKLWLLIV